MTSCRFAQCLRERVKWNPREFERKPCLGNRWRFLPARSLFLQFRCLGHATGQAASIKNRFFSEGRAHEMKKEALEQASQCLLHLKLTLIPTCTYVRMYKYIHMYVCISPPSAISIGEWVVFWNGIMTAEVLRSGSLLWGRCDLKSSKVGLFSIRFRVQNI